MRPCRPRSGWRPGRPPTSVVVKRAHATLREITAEDDADLARLSVGLRVVRTMLTTDGHALDRGTVAGVSTPLIARLV